MKTKIIAHGVATQLTMPLKHSISKLVARTVYKLANYKHDYENSLTLNHNSPTQSPPMILVQVLFY